MAGSGVQHDLRPQPIPVRAGVTTGNLLKPVPLRGGQPYRACTQGIGKSIHDRQ
jgi:hypothetical protein